MFWANPPERNWKRFVVAILAVALGTAVRLGLLAGLEQRAAYVTFFPAVMAAAFYGGFPAGMLATILSALAVSYWWIEPPGNPFIISHPMDALGMAVFVTSGVIISLLAEVTHRAWARAS
ncbi:MAG TPA: hypothetical protein DCZ69_03850, partial [Syntrophobacteraceae bacterium]|nr:hypothetical protein [Syntrophobacteraceae bacterium]